MEAKPKVKSKTLWINGVVGGLSAAALAAETLLPKLEGIVPAEWYLGIAVTLPAINFWLRLITKEPVK